VYVETIYWRFEVLNVIVMFMFEGDGKQLVSLVTG
jgi:hypothetical protein